MALETGTYISDLNVSNPANTDGVTQADDHLRFIKSTVKATFPNITGAVTPTHTELNYVDGVTSAIQTQLDAKAVLAGGNTFTGNQTITGNLTVTGSVTGVFPSGTKMLFQQTSAPTGWTKDLTHDNKSLRVVTGTAGSGGSVAFTTAFANQTVSGSTSSVADGGTVGDTTLTIAQIPSHTHNVTYSTNAVNGGGGTSPSYLSGTINTKVSSAEGGGGSHTHSFTSTPHSHTFSGSVNLEVQYVDLIIATKN
jgi:hypothetical protein